MKMYEVKIKKQETGFKALVVRIDYDSFEQVVFGKWYSTENGAKRGCALFLKKLGVEQ
jgi:hypothetical protein